MSTFIYIKIENLKNNLFSPAFSKYRHSYKITENNIIQKDT